MAEQDFTQNSGTPELPTNKVQALAKLLDKEDDVKKEPITQEQYEKARANAREYVTKEQRKAKLKRDIQLAIQTLKPKSRFASNTQGRSFLKNRAPQSVNPPSNPGRFYAPESTFGQDNGVRELGRFPLGRGLTQNLPPLLSTNEQGQARAGLKMRKPPMFGGL